MRCMRRTVVLCAVLYGVAGCSATEFLAEVPAEQRLQAGALPLAVPPVPDDGALGLAQQHFHAGNFGYAARYFEQAVSLHPQDGEAWLGLAAAYDRLRRFDLADRAYAEAARLEGQTVPYLNNVGYSRLMRGELGAARRSFMQALAMDPQNATILNNLKLLDRAAVPAAAGA